ncbi:MAG: mechanosensitive ion channel protein MscS [Acidobacteria bacterium]|nr:MAG: mechanosensitive ion channel protein MscS [Acidobacteriota bacterium]
MNYIQWIVPIGFLLAGYAFGRIFDRWIVRRLKRIARKSESKADDILLDSIGSVTIIWFSLIGAYAAIASATLPADFAGLLNRTIKIAFIASGTLFVARLAVGYVNLYAARVSGVLPSTTIFSNLTRVLVCLIGLLITLQTLGISITPILTALGVGGLAVALALRDTLSNLFSGLQIVASGQVRPGDFIKLDSGEEGYVVDVTWRNTTIRELSNNTIIVPNSNLASSRVRNFNQPAKELAVQVQMGVSYDSDLIKVERVTIEVARDVMRTVPGGIRDFEPFIRYHTFSDFSIDFTVIMRGMEFVDQYLIKHEFVKRLHERYKTEKIEIPFPVRTVHIKGEPDPVRSVSAGTPGGID